VKLQRRRRSSLSDGINAGVEMKYLVKTRFTVVQWTVSWPAVPDDRCGIWEWASNRIINYVVWFSRLSFIWHRNDVTLWSLPSHFRESWVCLHVWFMNRVFV